MLLWAARKTNIQREESSLIHKQMTQMTETLQKTNSQFTSLNLPDETH